MITQKKIKIAHIITRMDRGGAPDVVRILIEQMDPVLFEVDLIYGLTQSPTDQVRRFLEEMGPSARLIHSLRRQINPLFDIAAFFSIWAVLRKGRYDIVHTHTSKAGFLGRIAARCTGARAVVHSPHGHDFYGYFGALGSRLVVWGERFAATFCDKIHALTALEKKDMELFGVASFKKIVVIYTGVELGQFRRDPEKAKRLKEECGIPAGAPVVGFAGRLAPVKGPEYFIRAAAHARKAFPDAHFLVAGDGELRPRLESEAKQLGISEVIHFIGWQEDAASVYSAIDILVLPSLNEAVGRSLLEAQAMGVPVIASKVGGIPEIVQDGLTGVLVAPSDDRALANAMERLLLDPSWRETLARAANARVKELFSDTLMVRHFIELYREMHLRTKRHG